MADIGSVLVLWPSETDTVYTDRPLNGWYAVARLFPCPYCNQSCGFVWTDRAEECPRCDGAGRVPYGIGAWFVGPYDSRREDLSDDIDDDDRGWWTTIEIIEPNRIAD